MNDACDYIKKYFTLEQKEQDIRRYSTQYALRLLLTISRKSRVNAIETAKAIAETVKFKGISTTTEMVSVLNAYSMHCERSNRYQIISTLADCSGWFNDVPPDTHVKIWNSRALGRALARHAQSLRRRFGSAMRTTCRTTISSRRGRAPSCRG